MCTEVEIHLARDACLAVSQSFVQCPVVAVRKWSSASLLSWRTVHFHHHNVHTIIISDHNVYTIIIISDHNVYSCTLSSSVTTTCILSSSATLLRVNFKALSSLELSGLVKRLTPVFFTGLVKRLMAD